MIIRRVIETYLLTARDGQLNSPVIRESQLQPILVAIARSETSRFLQIWHYRCVSLFFLLFFLFFGCPYSFLFFFLLSFVRLADCPRLSRLDD
jgi:hypothetical protein